MRRRRTDTLNHPELDDRLREPIDDEERELMDPDTWDWDNVQEGLPNPSPHAIFEVRLSLAEISQIELAAEAKGMTVIAFLKDAALQAARQGHAKERRAS